MKFTVKHLFGLTLAIAVLLAGLFFVHRMLGPDPSSERFVVLGKPHLALWDSQQMKTLPSALVAKSEPFGTAELSSDATIKLDQSLFQFGYNDFMKQSTFEVQFKVTGNASSDWSEYYILPVVTGGGNVGAGCEVTSSFNPIDLTLTVNLHQQFNNAGFAKSTTLRFQWQGKQFVYVKPPPPRGLIN